MINIEKKTKTAGAYVLYDGYFLFMFGFGSHHKSNELGVVRFGGHRKLGETVMQCVAREVKEEASLDIVFHPNVTVYVTKEDGKEYEKRRGTQEINPILMTEGRGGRLYVTYLTHGKGVLTPHMETQGILLLRKEDVEMICTKNTTFRAYKENGGKYILADPLPEDCVLVPHTQLRFLNELFTLEREQINAYMKN